jgi:hypothetical protein
MDGRDSPPSSPRVCAVPARGPASQTESRSRPPFCSFCGLAPGEGRRMISVPAASICEECVRRATAVFASVAFSTTRAAHESRGEGDS